MFPYRAGAQMGKISQYSRYAVQNLQYWLFPHLVSQCKPDVVLVHSSFHNFLNLLTPVIRRISRTIPVIADVRDHQLPIRRLGQLDAYSAVIACSRNVQVHLEKNPVLSSRVTHIPVIQESLITPRTNTPQTLQRHRLTTCSYLLFAGLIKQGKGVELLLRTYESYRAKGHHDELLLVGLCKDAKLLERASKIPGVRILGAVSRDELLDLMACARMNINLSGSEGMPRTSLEALALGTRVLLPQGIPEFLEYCPSAVACSDDPDALARQVEDLLGSPVAPSYPFELHAPTAVLPQYEALFASLLKQRVKASHSGYLQ